MPNHPEILWAQRSSTSDPKKNIVYLTINLPDIVESSLQCDLTSTSLKFKAKAGNDGKGLQEKEWEFNIDFYDEIDPEESSKRLNLRSLDFLLRKKELKAEFWPRLYKGPKLQFVKTNFDKWVDEDEQDEAKPAVEDEEEFNPMGAMGGGGGMPPGMGMGGMGGMGMPGLGGMGMPGLGGDMSGGGMENLDFEKMLADLQKSRNDPSGISVPEEDQDSDDSEGPPPPLEDVPVLPK